MNILYISVLDGGSWNGPTYSIPKQIANQKKIDNVFWYNLVEVKDKWKTVDYYHDISEYPLGKIGELPEPFNLPDLVIFEQFYGYTTNKIKKEVLKLKIPYIIIPRGELTKDAQSSKHFKKTIANILFMKSFADKAIAIQYLTQNECKQSLSFTKNKSIIVPNGVEIKQNLNKSFSEGRIKCVFIGRLDPFHKGLDLLIEACANLKSFLLDNNVSFEIYGANTRNKLDILKDMIKERELNEIVCLKSAVYDKEKEDVLLSSDIFVMTSRFEGHPMALVEALSYGLPCLVTTGTNMRLEIERSNAGWGADNTVESIIEAIKNMVHSKDRIKEVSKNALELAKEYSWSKLANMSHSEYCSLLSEKRKNK